MTRRITRLGRGDDLAARVWRDCDPDSARTHYLRAAARRRLFFSTAPDCLTGIHERHHHNLAALCGCSICNALLQGMHSHRKCERGEHVLLSVHCIIKVWWFDQLPQTGSWYFSELWPQMKQKKEKKKWFCLRAVAFIQP